MKLDESLPESLAQALARTLPGSAAQRTMEADLSYGRHFGPPRPDAKPAAVVALLHQLHGQWHLPLLLRPQTLAHHAGQISLPGGMLEPGESSEEAAMRELEEEIGTDRFGAVLLGRMSPIYLFGTNFLVAPWVAAVRSPIEFLPSAAEVQAILQVPLAHFLDPANRGQHTEHRGTLQFSAPHFLWHEHQIWGGTAMIMAELAAVVAALTAGGM